MSLEQLIAAKRERINQQQQDDRGQIKHEQDYSTEQSHRVEPVNVASVRHDDPDAVVIDIDLIDIHAQVRQEYDSRALEALADDIAAHGQDSPILVRPAGNGRYELVAGERRLRAKRILQRREPDVSAHHKIRATLKALDDEQKTNRQLAENIQREDLKPLEIARALVNQKEVHGYTDAQLADKINKDRSYVTRHLGLLGLSPELQYLIEIDEVKPRPALKHRDKLVQSALDEMPQGLRDQVAQGELTTLAALKARASWQAADGQSAEHESHGGDRALNSGAVPTRVSRAASARASRLSVSMPAAEALADLLGLLAEDMALNPIKVSKQKGKPVRKELLATLETRAQDVLQAYRGKIAS
ncbi:hypothetical protein Tel_17015 (plasmid) [Candidatus Tenderia electrophaga]|uniref:ParB-like N-terminal domain-containing protein n=1 Tax=Candidatus Tenderia electrophaga TaxID=1748243 RepID=A0A0S2TIH1_9GAMM|nr:hypothetical protein Tel_17015 [Candidatus Tenderia electrophaga]